LLSQRVEILNNRGKKILGVVSSTPPHFLPESQRSSVLAIDSLFIDIGASSRDEVMEDFGIRIGNPIAPLSEFTPLEKENLFMAKSFDNRVGMAGAIQSFQELEGEDLPCQLLVAGSVQEEVGLRGAKALAHFAKPDLVIVLEGPPADDTPGFSKADAQGKLGGGVQIRLFDPSAIGNPRLGNLVQKVAANQGINHQVTVRRSGGTDAGSFNVAESGIPCVVLGTPARYIHSHNGIIDISDYIEMVKLCVALAKSLDRKSVEALTDFLNG
jgi:endoglucanase